MYVNDSKELSPITPQGGTPLERRYDTYINRCITSSRTARLGRTRSSGKVPSGFIHEVQHLGEAGLLRVDVEDTGQNFFSCVCGHQRCDCRDAVRWD